MSDKTISFRDDAGIEHHCTIEVTAGCPFCGGQYSAGHFGDEREPMLMHTMPFCREYEVMDVADFMEAARIKRYGGIH